MEFYTGPPPKKAEDIYGTGWEFLSSYTPIIESFGNAVIIEYFGNYDGEAFALYDEGGKIGFLVFGYGTCSICDALQGCENNEDVNKLIDSLWRSIRWFDSPEEALQYFRNKDWGFEWYASEKVLRSFLEKVENYLKAKIAEKNNLK